jgi:hypothetical protein
VNLPTKPSIEKSCFSELKAKEVKTILDFDGSSFEEESSNSFINNTMKNFPVYTMSSKEAAYIVPKWNIAENIVNFCKKVQSAWEYCEGESFEETKFLKILRLSLPTDVAEVYDNLPEDQRKTVALVTENLIVALDKDKAEYLRDLSELRKQPSESFTSYGIRVKRLYIRGTGMSSKTLTSGEKIMLVEKFFDGLTIAESSSLRMTATDDELKDLDKLVKRAARLRLSSRQTKSEELVNAVTEKSYPGKVMESKIPSKSFQRRPFKGDCHFCQKPGHSWRKCFARAKQSPEWSPSNTKMNKHEAKATQ